MKKSAGVMEGKADGNKNKKSEECDKRKTKKDEESSSKKTLPKKQKQKSGHDERKIQRDQVKEGSSSKLPMKEGKDADDLAIKSHDKIKEVTQNEKLEEHNEGKEQKEQDDSLEEETPQNQPQQQEGINGEFELNVVTNKNRLPKNTDETPKDNNIDGGSKLPISVEKDANYYRLKQGIPRSTKFRSIASIYMRTERLSPVEAEYNWSGPRTLRSKKCGVQNKDKIGKEQDGTLEETLPFEQKQKATHDESKNLDENSATNNSNRALMDNNVDNTSGEKDDDCHASKGIPKNKSFFYLLEVVRNETEERNMSNKREDQKDSFEEELPDQQQQQVDINGEVETNKVTCEISLSDNTDRTLSDNSSNYGLKLLAGDDFSKEELPDQQQQQLDIKGDEKDGGYIREDQNDSSKKELPDQQKQQLDTRGESFDLNKVKHENCLPDNINRISKDNSPKYGSQLWKKDEKDGNLHMTHGIPRSIKFRSITNLYKCTTRLSPVENEYNWDLTKEDSSGKKDAGCKRKWSENRKSNA